MTVSVLFRRGAFTIRRIRFVSGIFSGGPFEHFAVPIAAQVLLPLALSDGDQIADEAVKGRLRVSRRGGRDGHRLEADGCGPSGAITSVGTTHERLHNSERRVPDALVPLAHIRRVQSVNGRYLMSSQFIIVIILPILANVLLLLLI